MKIEIKKYLQYLFLVVLFLGAIQPGYANDLGELRSEKVAEKSAHGTDVFKSWEVQYDAGNTTLIKNPVSLQKLSDLISNPNLTSSNLTEDLVRRAIKGNRGKSTWQLLLYFGEGFLGSEIATILGCAGGGIISGALDYCLSSDFTVEGLFGVVSFQIKAVIVQCTFAPKIGKFVQRIKFKFPSFEQIPYNTLARKIIQFTDELGQNLLNVNFRKIPKLVKSWKNLFESADPGIKALRTDVPSLQKFDDIVQSNNLGLDENGLKAVLDAAAVKGQQWDFPENILDAVKRASDGNISGMAVKHKKFPTPSEGSDPFVLKNAKQYQKEASGDAGLSFEVGGRSFDDVASDGKLIDRKYGHGSSVFNPDGTVKNQTRANKIIQQATEQVNAANGQPIRWEISTELGADGIQELFTNQGINIEVIHVAQQTIIN